MRSLTIIKNNLHFSKLRHMELIYFLKTMFLSGNDLRLKRSKRVKDSQTFSPESTFTEEAN